MKTNFVLLSAAVAIAALSSCSSDDAASDANSLANDQTPVAFSSYLGQSARTRADITTKDLQSDGFGVFAYYTKTDNYETDRTSATPNFMYNTKVSGDNWSYSPLRYWPNANVDESGKETQQYVSFFAYAPYEASASATGITALPSNTTTGDPILSYTTAGSVDLLWGTAGSTSGASTGKAYSATAESTDANATKVNADLSKQAISGKVDFLFKHATAKFGGYKANTTGTATKEGITVDVEPDVITAGTGTLDNSTKVTVKSITIKVQNAPATDGGAASALKTSGKFNLVTGEWTLDDPATDASDFTEKFTTTAGTDASVNNTLNSSIAEPATVSSFTDLPEGVTTTAKNIYNSDAENSLLLLPGQTPRFVVTIDYIVRTQDATLAKGYTEVEQTITKNVDFKTAVSANKKYNLAIHLGLTSVKFNATVEDWTDNGNSSSESGSGSSESASVDMPLNVE